MKKEIKATFNEKEEVFYRDFKKIVNASKKSDSDIIKLALKELLNEFKKDWMDTPMGQMPEFLSDKEIQMKTEMFFNSIRKQGGPYSHFANHQNKNQEKEVNT